MTVPYPYGEEAIVVKRVASGTDRLGTQVIVDGEQTVYPNVFVIPRDANGVIANEAIQGLDLVTIGMTVFFPHGAVVNPEDQVIARGQRWDVYGIPQYYHSPRTNWNPGVPVALIRAVG